jgi:hypothetical protein
MKQYSNGYDKYMSTFLWEVEGVTPNFASGSLEGPIDWVIAELD